MTTTRPTSNPTPPVPPAIGTAPAPIATRDKAPDWPGSVVPGRLRHDFPHLLVHTNLKKLELAGPICAAENLGAVICAPQLGTRRDVTDLIRRYGSLGANGVGLVLDANRYSGKNRAIGTEGMSEAWITTQLKAGIAHPLTNAGYIPAGQHHVLHEVLQASADMGPRPIATLAIANQYLNRDNNVLIEEINNAGMTVGLMVEHRDDPFGPRANVRGLINLLTHAEVPVLLLRSDLSVIGALAWGARAGAFGTSTSLRHIFPVDAGGGPPGGASVSAIVQDTMSLNRLEKIDDAMHLLPDDTLWNCQCTICGGRPLSWIGNADEAFSHSLSVVASLASHVLDNQLTAIQRREQWSGLCRTAQHRALELENETHGAWGEAPQFLGSWLAQPTD